MNRKFLLATTAAVSLIASAAFAQEEGFYIGVGGGLNAMHSSDIDGPTFNDELNNDEGFVGAGVLGYKYNNGLRSELELGYRKNDVDEINDVTADGETEVYSAMVNLLFDLDISESVDTYIGGGAGGAFVRHDKVGPTQATRVDDTEFVPAFQGIAGLSYALSNKADIFLNYQYFHAVDPNFKNEANTKVDVDYDSSTVMLGLKVNLSDTEPMRQARPSDMVDTAYDPVTVDDMGFADAGMVDGDPMQMGAPVSRTYIVFFDLDDESVTHDARAILSQAAEDAMAGNAVSIQVVGHADASGGDSYNMGLSQRRANSVRSELSAMGINSGMMDTIARGETDLLVPTADGVREAQNRRVEVTYIINP